MGGRGSRQSVGTPPAQGQMAPPRLRPRGSAGPFGAELGASVPDVVSCLLLYITWWAPPIRRVAGTSSHVRACTKKLKRKIMKGQFLAEAELFEGRRPRHAKDLGPEVVLLVVRDYLRRLPGGLLQDAAGWHRLGHDLLALSEEPWHHHMPSAFLTTVLALRRAMTPAHNLLLDQVVAAIRAAAATPHDTLITAQWWAAAAARPPSIRQCTACAFLPRNQATQGEAHTLYYLARFSLMVHPRPFSRAPRGLATPWGTQSSTEGAPSMEGNAEPRVEQCDVCHQHHAT